MRPWASGGAQGAWAHRGNVVLCALALVMAAELAGGPTSWGVEEAVLPPGAKVVWDADRAYHLSTPTRERICLNGLWQWQPARRDSEAVPSGGWGYFKIPGCWPGITDYMQKDSQTVHAHPAWKDQRLGPVNAAWHQRQISVPVGWSNRRITVRAEYLNSFAAVYVDGNRAGEMHFPGGEVDITSFCRPGDTHRLSMLVVAMPLKGVMLSYTDSASAREVQGTVSRRGLCGDVYLECMPSGPKITDLRADTSVRKPGVAIDAALAGLSPGARFRLRARISREAVLARDFTSEPFQGSDLMEGRFSMADAWMPHDLWDTHTPLNTFLLEVSLLDADGRILDTAWPQRFGFREFWIDGRDFFLNGTRLFLSAVPLDNAQVSAGLATYASARESFERLQSFGINCVYTHNYGCEPGSHLGFEEILCAADDVGMLVSFSQPHFSHYSWETSDADRSNGYARHARFYVRAAQNHPSVVMYSMSHNATGYSGDMNPDWIDGIHDARDRWASRNVEKALRAEAIVNRLDPSRIIYHHASGNLGAMHPVNFYPNFAPVQELSDWFEHWATEGIKPVFTCEYGAPFSWDWTRYRGWYDGTREFGSAAVPWEFCLAEWNAQFFGDRAYQISEPEKTNLRWEAGKFRAGQLWHRWDYPYPVGSSRFEERYPVFATYLTDNWRAFRTWGVSANSPWEHGHFWTLRDGVDPGRRELPVDWDNLQRPGFSPDYIDQRYQRMDLAFERSDWIATPAAQALLRNNRPLLAYIGGKPARFTSTDHNFLPEEEVAKQIIVINNSRENVTCDAQWSLGLPHAVTGNRRVDVAAGTQERIALHFRLPADLQPGQYPLSVQVKFSTGEIQQDTFSIDVLPPLPSATRTARVAVFDPAGETGALLDALRIPSQPVGADADLAGYEVLVVGKSALTPGGSAPDISQVRDGLRVVIFEQSSDVLEKRFGFRVQEYGLRQLFPRVPDHPMLRGLSTGHLRDWRGEATILPPRLKLASSARYNGAPTATWCGLSVPRLWRCGNLGNVASVLIEKPACGDFLPLLDGGYGLQYSPLIEFREGRGIVIFCQVDVTGRTETEPAAKALVRNLFSYVSAWEPMPRRSAVYVGDAGGRNHLESVGVSPEVYDGGQLLNSQVLVIGQGGGKALAEHRISLAQWLQTGGNILAIGLDQEDVNAFLPFDVILKQEEHIAAFFDPKGVDPLLAGIGPADVHNRDPRILPLVSAGAQVIGNGILARADQADVIFCQLEPWEFEPGQSLHLRQTHRRASFLVTRLLANMGVAGTTPLLDRFHRPWSVTRPERRWLTGFYIDQPDEWDDPYRFFRW